MKKTKFPAFKFCDLSYVVVEMACPNCGSDMSTDMGHVHSDELKQVHECYECSQSIETEFIVNLTIRKV